jgi:hypothetical protein
MKRTDSRRWPTTWGRGVLGLSLIFQQKLTEADESLIENPTYSSWMPVLDLRIEKECFDESFYVFLTRALSTFICC